LLQFQQALDTYRTSSWLGSGLSSGGAYPPLNVFRKGDDIVVIGDNAALHRRERRAGSFDRAITVPVEIDVDRVTAECHDGMLALFLPRAERDKPKSITVR
jgi:HSP20 family protein